MKNKLTRFLPFLVFSILAFFLWRGLFLQPQNLPSAEIGKTVNFIAVAQLDSTELFSPNLLKGKLSLLNVWASWCGACSEEQLFLSELAEQGIPIYGLNYRDNPKNARRWLADWGNPYVAVGEDQMGKAAMDLGVYGAPETFLVDAHGKILYRHVGVLDQHVWQNIFVPLINKQKGA